MKINKSLISIHLNEFNLNFLKYGAKKYKCENIKKYLKLNKVKTYSIDKIQDKDLDPWVQSVSINLGKNSKKHKTFKIGQNVNKKQTQIWDYLSKKKINCGVWGAMNSKLKKNKYLKFYFPDPWNNSDLPYPKNLEKIFYLPRSYAQKYTDFKITREKINILNFFVGCIQFGILSYFIKNFNLYFKIFYNTGFKNYFLFFLFDIISLKIHQKLSKKNINFSLIFLNSLAHYQHNNWDEKKNHWKYFLLVDEIFNIINQIQKDYDSIIIFNGMSQKKIKKEFIIRPKNFDNFFNNLDIRYKKILPDMTTGGFMYFNTSIEKKKSLKILENYNLYGFKIFEIKIVSKLKIYFRIQIKSSTKKNMIKNSNFKDVIDYEKNSQKIQIRKINYNLKDFLKNTVFLKTTGKHINSGDVISKNIKIPSEKFENIKIYSIIKNYFLSA